MTRACALSDLILLTIACLLPADAFDTDEYRSRTRRAIATTIRHLESSRTSSIYDYNRGTSQRYPSTHTMDQDQAAISAFALIFNSLKTTASQMDNMSKSMNRMEMYMLALVVLIYVLVGIFALLTVCYAFRQYKERTLRKRRAQTRLHTSLTPPNHTGNINKDVESGTSSARPLYSSVNATSHDKKSPEPVTPLTAQQQYHNKMREMRKLGPGGNPVVAGVASEPGTHKKKREQPQLYPTPPSAPSLYTSPVQEECV